MALDWYQIATLIVAILFGGQGLHSWRKAREAKASGLTPPTDDFLSKHYQEELKALRGNQTRELDSIKRENSRLRRRHESDSLHIDDLEAHIWEGKPPPPPRRRTTQPKELREE